jgi:endonuclease/exonuclease/phosphatase (EEP) superfamily protein YafD
MRLLLTMTLTLVAAGLAVVSFLALAETNVWWVRMTDFPRLQYVIASVVLLVALVIAKPVAARVRIALAAIALAALSFNAVKLAPYLAPTEGTAAACPVEQAFSIMLANVQMENRNTDELLEIVRQREPDLFLALETNEFWDRNLSPLSDTMPETASHIDEDYYGMHVFSRLPLSTTQILFPAEGNTPSIRTTIELPSGDDVAFVGLHPRPPHPRQSSAGRDAELMWTALRARDAGAPVVLAGDLNAVPWERSVARTQRIAQLVDPRRGTGLLPTYNAKSWWMAWPLDQVLYQPGLDLVSMEVLRGFGSDHYPVEVTLCHRSSERSPPTLRPGDIEEAETSMETARRENTGED